MFLKNKQQQTENSIPPPPIFNYIILIKYFALGSSEYALLTPP